MNDNSSFVGMFIIDMSDMTVLAGSDSKFPKDLKALGGMLKCKSTGEPETIREALKREIHEEGQTDAEGELVYVNPCNNGHTQYFFLATKVNSTLKKGSEWKIQEKDEKGDIVEEITAKWVPFAEFVQRLYKKQYAAFGAVLARLAEQRPELLCSKRFYELTVKFPKPQNLGIEGVQVD